MHSQGACRFSYQRASTPQNPLTMRLRTDGCSQVIPKVLPGVNDCWQSELEALQNHSQRATASYKETPSLRHITCTGTCRPGVSTGDTDCFMASRTRTAGTRRRDRAQGDWLTRPHILALLLMGATILAFYLC